MKKLKSAEIAIETRNLVKNFGSIRALAGLSFQVGQGEIYGLIGPNGAGKTTALRIMATLIKPTSGSAEVFGFDVEKQGVTVLLSSHNMLEVEFLCNRVALINEGKIVGEGSPQELKSSYSAQNLEEVFMEATSLE